MTDIYHDSETILNLSSRRSPIVSDCSSIDTGDQKDVVFDATAVSLPDLSSSRLFETPDFLVTKIKDEVYAKLLPFAKKCNHNGEITDPDLFNLSTFAIQYIESYSSLLPPKSGKQKKEIILSILDVMVSRIVLDAKMLQNSKKFLKEVIPNLIDIIVLTSRGGLNINKKDAECCCVIM
jgi:hypothetical protein